MLGAWKARLLLSLLEAYRIMPCTADVQCVHACWKSKMLMGLSCWAWKARQLGRFLRPYGYAPRRYCALCICLARGQGMLARSETHSARPWPEGSAVMMMMSVAHMMKYS